MLDSPSSQGHSFPALSFINRLVKVLAGGFLGAFFFSSMTVMTCVLVFRLNPNESDYGWITNIAFLGGIATGAVLLSRAKWWQIALVAVVVLTMFMVMMSQTE